MRYYVLAFVLGLLGATAVHFIPKAFAQGDLAFTVVKVTGTTTGMSFERYENTEAVCYKLGNISCFKK